MPDDKLKYITTKIISMEQGYYTLPLLDGSKVEDVNSTSIPFNVMLTISESSVARDKIPEEVTIVEHSFVLRQNGQRIEDRGNQLTLGTRSLLFGNHQFLLHPIFVTWGWKKYHGKWPNWKELICIVIHDWGYWGKPNMDGEEGQDHPWWAANRALMRLDPSDGSMRFKYHNLCLYHSGRLAKQDKRPMSDLGWPDKLGSILQPWWLWVGLGLLSGEIHEYTNNPEFMNILGHPGDYKEYFMAYRKHVLKQVVYK